jgi:signal transduction histidine kinase
VRRFVQQILDGTSGEIEYRVNTGGAGPMWLASRGRVIPSAQGELVGLTGITWEVTERKKTEAAIQNMNASLHQLTGELLRLQDEERRRLARELHDGPVQTLSAAAMNLSVLIRSPNLASLALERKMAGECLAWVKQCSEEMRSLSYLLHPPVLDEFGLNSALRGWIQGFIDRTGLEVDTDLGESGRLGVELETALFRIAQEALGNVHRHSRSTTASVRIRRLEGSIVLEVEDQGHGIPAGALDGRSQTHALGVGIRGMRERARQLDGDLTIHSQPGQTLIRVMLPVKVVA